MLRREMAWAVVCTAIGAVASCGGSPLDERLASVSFPLFTEFDEQAADLIEARELAGRPRSCTSSGVDWMPSLDAAFARATSEDKPVLLVSYVHENGDPGNDV